MPVRVLLVDDHPLVQAGLRAAIARAPGLELVGESRDARAAVGEARRLGADIVVVDPRADRSALDAVARLRALAPATRVLVLSESDELATMLDAVRAGAQGYLLKDTDPVRLPHALRGVLAGEAALPRALVARVIDEFRDRGRRKKLTFANRRGVELTSREWEVLDLMYQKLSTAEIAERLFVSQVTVRSHIAAILKKLRVDSRADALKLMEER